jgi:hypothetical protein
MSKIGRGGMGKVYRAKDQKARADPGVMSFPAETGGETLSKRHGMLPWAILAVVVILAAGIFAWYATRKPEPAIRQVIRFTCQLPEGQQLAQYPQLTVSPDGSKFIYGTEEGLYICSVDALDARRIPGMEPDAVQPCFSHDGRWIAYWVPSDRKLKKIAVSGGASVGVCNTGLRLVGISWTAQDTILYSDLLGSGIMRVPSSGGTPECIVGGRLEGLNDTGVPIAPQMLLKSIKNIQDWFTDNILSEIRTLDT